MSGARRASSAATAASMCAPGISMKKTCGKAAAVYTVSTSAGVSWACGGARGGAVRCSSAGTSAGGICSRS